MDPARWDRVRLILENALAAEEPERAAIIDAAVGDDEELRAEVESLLDAQARAGDLLDSSPVRRPMLADAAQVGQRVGSYLIEGLLGQGGMGEVYRARRADGTFEQRVAIKMVRPDVSSRGLLERFATERQVLADLAHPHIARLLDGGTDEEGSPYFVMELIEGRPADQYCDEERLGIEQRLELFAAICETVGFAHDHGLIHRDLKPGNLLVTASGDHKLLDFGLVKVFTPEEATAATTLHAFTPRYASPEQRLGAPVSFSTDVYSLGVLLHELLSGSDSSHWPATVSLPGEIPSLVPLPSEAVARLGSSDPNALDEAAAARGTVPTRLQSRLRGDLDAIVRMAVQPDAAERYATAGELAADVRAFLDGRPVRARRSGRLHALRHGLRAHAPRALAAVVVLAATSVAAIALWWPPPDSPLPAFQGSLSPVVSWPSREWSARPSPDGSKVAFLSDRAGRIQLWVHDLETRTSLVLLDADTDTALGIAWSDDGSRLLLAEQVEDGTILRTIGLDGSALEETALPVQLEQQEEVRMRWLADGVYVLSEAAIWRFDVATGAPERMTREDVPWQMATADVHPLTKRVVFSASDGETEDLWVSNLDGTDARQLTFSPDREYVPSWIDPDGDRVSFVSNRRGQIDLFELEISSGRTRFLTSDLNREVAAFASRSGERLIFSAVYENADLWRIDPATGTASQMTADSQSDLWPQATASGRVVFHRTLPTLGRGFRQLETEVLTTDRTGIRPGDPFATRLTAGYLATVSPDERWLTFARRPEGEPRIELWAQRLGAEAAVMVTEAFWPSNLHLFPLGWWGAHVAWGPDATLYYVARERSGSWAIRRYGAEEADHRRVTSSSSAERFVDILPGSQRLAYVVRQENQRFVATVVTSGSELAAYASADRRVLWRSPPHTRVRLLAWRGEGLVIATGTADGAAPGFDILHLSPDGTASPGVAAPRGFIETATVLPEADSLVYTAIENGVHNLYRLSLTGGAPVQLTRNTLPSVSFSAPSVTPAGDVIVSRQEDDSNVWMLGR